MAPSSTINPSAFNYIQPSPALLITRFLFLHFSSLPPTATAGTKSVQYLVVCRVCCDMKVAVPALAVELNTGTRVWYIIVD